MVTMASNRQLHNQNALAYNTSIQGFPGNVFAHCFHFDLVVFCAAEEAATRDVRATFTAA